MGFFKEASHLFYPVFVNEPLFLDIISTFLKNVLKECHWVCNFYVWFYKEICFQ